MATSIMARIKDSHRKQIEGMVGALDEHTRKGVLAHAPHMIEHMREMFPGECDEKLAMIAESYVALVTQIMQSSAADLSEVLLHTSTTYAVVHGLLLGAYELPEEKPESEEHSTSVTTAPWLRDARASGPYL